MDFVQDSEPPVEKPVMIAAMRDMGSVGSIVVEFIARNLNTVPFRTVRSGLPRHVIDRGGYIDLPDDRWDYSFTKDLIVFGGRSGQPQTGEELHSVCQDVIDVAKKYSAKFVYTVGGFHTGRPLGKLPMTFVTATSPQLTGQLEGMNFDVTPQESVITGFNGLILGYAKNNGIRGVGLYGELNEPEIPQYRAAKSVIKTLERLTYRRFGDTSELDMKAESVDQKTRGRRGDPGA